MLSAALLIFTFFRPMPPAPAPMGSANVEQQVSERLAAEVRKAVAESEARQEKKTAELLTAAERRFEQQRESDMDNVAAEFLYLQKKYNVIANASYETGGMR